MAKGKKDKEVQPAKVDPKPVELAVLAYALIYPHRFYEVSLLSEDHFEVPLHRTLWRVLLSINADNGQGAINDALVVSRLAAAGVPQDQSFALMTEASDYAPGPDAIHPLIEEIVARNMRVSLDQVGDAIKQIAGTSATPDEMADQASSLVMEATRRPGSAEVVSLAGIIEDEVNRIENGEKIEQGYSTGFYDLDQKTGGVHKGEMIVIAARPSVGKSALLGNIAVALSRQGLPGAIFSLEMPSIDWARRAACADADVDLSLYRKGSLNPLESAKALNAMKDLMKLPVYIYDRGSLSMSQLSSTCRRLVHEHGVAWVGIDYLQLMNHQLRDRDNTNDAVGRTSNAIKALARDLEIPIMALSQLNRAVENRPDHKPRKADLRDSGSLEQDADVIIFVHRPLMYSNEEEQQQYSTSPTEPAELIVDKQRNGPTGPVSVVWVRSSARFQNAARGDCSNIPT